MALVPFHVSGAAASQDLEERLMQVGQFSLLLRQRPRASGNTAHLKAGGEQQQGRGVQAAAAAGQQESQHPDLSQVGLVLWQSGFVLADFLLLRLAGAGGAVGSSSGGVADSSRGSWAGVRVLELGCGGGTVGLLLALAGAQVVLTDQQHILSLTRENLALNFPAIAASGRSSHRQPEASQGRFFSPPTEQQGAAQSAVGASPAGAIAEQAAGSLQGSAVQQPLSAAAAFAAAFGSPTGHQAAAAVSAQQQHQQQQQQQSEDSTECLANQVYGPGPLVIEYSWGEPLQLLQDRLAAAAGERLDTTSAAAAAAASASQLATDSTTQSAAAGAVPLRQMGTCPPAGAPQPPPAPAAGFPPGMPSRAGPGLTGGGRQDQNVQGSSLQQLAAQPFDVVVGADLLYDFRHHASLLNSLQQFAAVSPHLQVFLCWRYRVLGEQAFLEAATAAGWVYEGVPVSMLHPEFQTGYYKLVRMVRLP